MADEPLENTKITFKTMFGYRKVYKLRNPKYNMNMHSNKIICSNCESDVVGKRGTFETKAHGKQQRYFCKNCNKKFIVRSPFYRMRNSPRK